MTLEENIAYLQDIIALASRGAAPVADAMARHLVQRARDDTLRRSSHAPGAWHRTRPGEPPARATGNLARSMMFKPASKGLRASAVVGNTADYSRILEFGCVVTPVNKKFMHWTDSGGSWYHTMLMVPPHPFLRPATEEAIADGSLRDAAIEEFRKYDP